ncbi:MAG TPA: hypothetical protein VK066_13405 [Chloroflexota bacterium]|nr:hypothetical protein [Chloroflexota bacterium]
MQVSAIRRTVLGLGAVAVLALSTSGLVGTVNHPAVAEASVEAHHHAYWRHVPVAYRYFYGPRYAYSYEWYLARHLSFPALYRIYAEEPVGICVTEYYFYGGSYYCYIG